MAKYLIKRLIRGLVSVVIVVVIVLALVYSLIDREYVFKGDTQITKYQNNEKTNYKYSQWENYGYLDKYDYADYLQDLVDSGELTVEEKNNAAKIGKTSSQDSTITAKYVKKFKEYCDENGYTVMRLNAVMQGSSLATGGKQFLFAYKEYSVLRRAWDFFANLIQVDSIHYVEDDGQLVGERGLTFTWYDPVYGGEKFSPAIIGNGTEHKYLLYFDNKFPYIHQNIVTINLGMSYAVNRGTDAFTTMTQSQGTNDITTTHYPTGNLFESSDNLHSATFVENSLIADGKVIEGKDYVAQRFVDNYTSVGTIKQGPSRMALSFVIGIISSIIAYVLGVPLGIMMARNKGKLLDKLGTIYIVFIIAVPSLAYIFMFRAIGMEMGLPGRYDIDEAMKNVLYYFLPIISLALPSVASLMSWLRRYMIDQQNSDYVKFARSGGLSEGEIFNKHILKNAIIPLVHGIPGTILGALTGAIITETLYAVPGTGRMLTEAIQSYDNAVIVGLTLFYATLSIISLILGDILMAMVDPRISFSDKAR